MIEHSLVSLPDHAHSHDHITQVKQRAKRKNRLLEAEAKDREIAEARTRRGSGKESVGGSGGDNSGTVSNSLGLAKKVKPMSDELAECDHCGTKESPGQPLMRCTRCLQVKYCSK